MQRLARVPGLSVLGTLAYAYTTAAARVTPTRKCVYILLQHFTVIQFYSVGLFGYVFVAVTVVVYGMFLLMPANPTFPQRNRWQRFIYRKSLTVTTASRCMEDGWVGYPGPSTVTSRPLDMTGNPCNPAMSHHPVAQAPVKLSLQWRGWGDGKGCREGGRGWGQKDVNKD